MKVGSLSLTLDETSGNAITVEDGAPMYDSEGVKQDNYFTFSLKNGGKIDTSYTIYLEDQPLDDGDERVGQSYVHYNLEKDDSVLPAKALEGDQAIDKGIIKSNQTINYKMRLWFSSDIPQSEENKVFKAKLNIVGSQNTKMMARGFDLTNDEKATITKVVFQDSIKSIDNESKVWDVSSFKNKTVMARMVPNTDDSSTNTLYIQGKGGVIANYTCKGLFDNFSKLLEIENLKLFDTSSVNNMGQMFRGCNSLTDLDVSNFDTSDVYNMDSMFAGCSKLKYINISDFDTSKVIYMACMFMNCYVLENLDVSNFDTSNVINMTSMFQNCNLINSLNISNFDTSKVINMSQMFRGCNGLKNLDLSNFDTSKVTSMYYMFAGCKFLINLDLRNATFDKVTSYDNMFSSVPSTINIITKDETTKNWLEDKLGGKGSVTIA